MDAAIVGMATTVHSLTTALLLTSFLLAVSGLSVRAAGRRARSGASVSKSRLPAREKEATAAARAEAPPLTAPWLQAIKKALNHGGTQRKRDRTSSQRKHVQIATVDPITGRPSVRTVVFRGFMPRKYVDDTARSGEESCCLMFITDDRSAKYQHLGGGDSSGAPIECCWWLQEAGVQFRIAGSAVLATARSEEPILRAAVDDVWSRLGPSTRHQFVWPHPGAPVGAAVATASKEDDVALEESHFVLIIVVPDSVDELHLGGNQRRYLHKREGNTDVGWVAHASAREADWTRQSVNP